MKTKTNNAITEICNKCKKEMADFRKLEKKLNPVKHSLSAFNLIEELHPDNKKMIENRHTRVLRAILEFDWEFKRSFLERCCRMFRVPKRGLQIEEERQYKKSAQKWSHDDQANRKEKGAEGKKLCRPDCLLWSPGKFAVIIENKINGAGETQNQLDNYLEAIAGDTKIFNSRITKKDVHVVYLGGDTVDMPSVKSLKKAGKGFLEPTDYLEEDGKNRVPGKKLHLVSYKDTIIPWLEEDVLPRCLYGQTGLVGGLMAYIDYLKNRFYDDDSEEERFYESREVVDLFRNKIEARLGRFFQDKYIAASEFVRLCESGKKKDKNESFFRALKHYYLTHHFRLIDSELSNEWGLRTTGSLIHLWKKSWEYIQKRPRPTCDLYFEFYPYQVDGFKFEYDDSDKRAVTCCLQYKGENERLQSKLDSILKKRGYIQEGGYVFNKATQSKKPFIVKRGEPFFDAFVKHKFIVDMCSVIEQILHKA